MTFLMITTSPGLLPEKVLIMKHKLALLVVLGLAATNAMACFTVYDKSNKIIYNAEKSPVDMSLPIHQTLPKLFPGGHMVFVLGSECPRDNAAAPIANLPKRTTGGSPLLTDRRTAESLKLPYTVLPSGAALISQRPDDMPPGVVLATSVPAPTAPPVIAAAPARPRSNTVITEMRDPPMTFIQTGNGVIVSELR